MSKVLVIQTAFIGDAILTLPMIQELKKRENLQVDVLCIPSTAEIFYASPFVNEVIVFDKRGIDKGVKKGYKFAKNLSKKGYSKIISPHRSLRTSLMVLLSGVKETYGFDNASFCHVYKHLIHYNSNIHEVERNFELAGIKKEKSLKNYLPELDFNKFTGKADNYIKSKNLSKFAIIAPSSVWETKRYPDNYFVKIIDYLYSLNIKVVLTGSQKDFELCEKIVNQCNNDVINSAGEFSIVETIALMDRAEIIISNDSAPTHFGLCTSTPVITIYCSTVPDFGFYPYKKESIYFSYNDLYCKPCGIHGYKECPTGTFDCAKKLKPEMIIEKIPELINE